MKTTHSIRRITVALMLLVAFLIQGTWALAGTTGGISGTVTDEHGAPVVAAVVTVISPSQTATSTTDAQGHYVFLTLAPDSYVLSVAKTGYQPTSIPGVTVFADNTQTVNVTTPTSLQTIAVVKSNGAGSLVKSGVGGDIYNVAPSQMAATASLGGGGNLDSAYSAIAAVPGLVVGTGGMGWNQAVIVRGNNPWFTGFEYDGIPVNRAFDNYTSSTASSLGLQELQVYTGGGPASISSSGTSGFINQVIKTGTYPGYGSFTGGLAGYGAFYHSARIEAGGASPDRNFSYYVGIGGYNQTFRAIDNNNGASYFGPGSMYGNYGYYMEHVALDNGVFNVCGPLGAGGPTTVGGVNPPQGCLPQFTSLYAAETLGDRENVANFHFGVPRKNGLKDDLQLLWSASALQTYNATAPNTDNGLNAFMVAITDFPYCGPDGVTQTVAGACAADGGPNFPHYQDSYAYNLPFGTNVSPGGAAIQPGIYYQANSPAHTFQAQMPLNTLNDLYNNDTGTVKLQYTHPFSDNSFLRLMGYSFFSDWTEDGVPSGYEVGGGFEYDSPNYDLVTHTAGAMIQYANQLNDKNLLTITGNYTHASVNRFNHTGSGSTSSASTPIGLISLGTNGQYTCYNKTSGAAVPCYSSTYQSNAAYVVANGATPAIPAGTPAGAYWATLYNGNANGTFNNVIPNFYSASIEDEFRPSDKLNINASVRFDQYSYGLGASGAQDPFYAQQVENYSCVNPVTHEVLVNPIGPGQYPPANPIFTNGDCDTAVPGGAVGFVHPNGQAQPGYSGTVPTFSLNVPGTYTMRYWEPRLSATYTQNPDTVWRASVGRYAEPPLSAAVDYLYRGGSAASLWTNFMALGAYSPFHAIPGQTSGQYDLSLEHRVHNTPLSFKISPFYSTTSNWEQQSFIGAGFVTQIPVGQGRSYGVEAQVNYGDFNQQGLSGLVSFTYTKSEVRFQSLLGSNQINDINQAIKNYNALTSAGGGSACYAPTADATPVACGGSAIANPYYNSAPQPLEDPNGWYQQGIYALKPGVYTGAPGFYASPYVTNIVLNYRHQKLAITPSIQFEAGTAYGTPYDITGVDPRNCGANVGTPALPVYIGNQGDTGAVAPGSATAANCNYLYAGPGAAPLFTYLYVPNPQTGSFASYGQYQEPTIAIANLQVSYDVSPKVRLVATASDLYHTCFGGSKEPWTAFAAPSSVNCGYYANGFYNGAGWYNGTSPSDAAANNGITSYPWETQSYLPKTGNNIGGFIPFTLYLQAQIRL
jgi:hypothetical protein